MKHIFSLVTCLIVFMAIAIAAGTTASAEACFSIVARAGGHPGEGVSEIASGAAVPGEPGSATDELAREVGLINQVREEIC